MHFSELDQKQADAVESCRRAELQYLHQQAVIDCYVDDITVSSRVTFGTI